MRAPAIYCIVLILILLSTYSFSQTLPVGTPVLEESWRRMQIMGQKDINYSFSIRPIYTGFLKADDSADNQIDLHGTNRSMMSFAKGKGTAKLLPLRISQQYNSHHPYGWNDGSMIPAKGYQQQLSFGLYSKFGPLSVQIQPEVVWAQNKAFSTFPPYHKDSIWRSYYNILNRIDNPERYGSGSYAKLFPGQSSVRLNLRNLSLGVSTENIWWGPAIRNSLIMSNNAPGIGHITFNTTSPLVTTVGSFEWQIIAGTLKSSGILPVDTARTFNGRKLYNPKKENDRYLNGMIITWQPKWTRGLHLGFSRVFYQYKYNIEESLNGYVPVFGAFFKDRSKDENKYGRDQMLSAFFRLIMPEAKAEMYAEYGRNDHSADLRDFLLEPEHARAYIVGARKIFTAKKQIDIELFTEFTHLQNPETRNVRELEGWYTHYQVRHGYTNRGQVIGAGIGPGGNSQTLGMKWIKGNKQIDVIGERVVRNNDFYYDAFGPFRNFSSHWVDLSINLNGSWQFRQFIYAANVSRVKSLNYQWIQYNDVKNWHIKLAASYLF